MSQYHSKLILLIFFFFFCKMSDASHHTENCTNILFTSFTRMQTVLVQLTTRQQVNRGCLQNGESVSNDTWQGLHCQETFFMYKPNARKRFFDHFQGCKQTSENSQIFRKKTFYTEIMRPQSLWLILMWPLIIGKSLILFSTLGSIDSFYLCSQFLL